MIKLKGQQQMQIEQLNQSQVEFIPKVQFEQTQEEDKIQQEVNIMNVSQIQQQPPQQQKRPLQLKLKNQFLQQSDKQLQEELELQRKLQQQEYVDNQMIEDLQEILAFDLNQGIIPQQQYNIIDKINNEDYIRILPQLPRKVPPIRLQKLQKNKKLQDELKAGRLYLNQEQLTNLDNQISKYLQEIQYKERQIQIKNAIYTLSSPFYISGENHPLILSRQWWYYKEKDCIKQYIIHSQVPWYLYSLFQLKQSEKIDIINQVIASQVQQYLNRWTGLIIDDQQENWFETNESSLFIAAKQNMKEQIEQNVDNIESNYIFDVKENIWFTNSQVNIVYYYHKIYNTKKTLVTYIKIQGLCYYTNLTTEEIVLQMFKYGISIMNSPSFEVVGSHELICWLCGKVEMEWSQLYVHECQPSQYLLSIREVLQSWNL